MLYSCKLVGVSTHRVHTKGWMNIIKTVPMRWLNTCTAFVETCTHCWTNKGYWNKNIHCKACTHNSPPSIYPPYTRHTLAHTQVSWVLLSNSTHEIYRSVSEFPRFCYSTHFTPHSHWWLYYEVLAGAHMSHKAHYHVLHVQERVVNGNHSTASLHDGCTQHKTTNSSKSRVEKIQVVKIWFKSTNIIITLPIDSNFGHVHWFLTWFLIRMRITCNNRNVSGMHSRA